MLLALAEPCSNAQAQTNYATETTRELWSNMASTTPRPKCFAWHQFGKGSLTSVISASYPRQIQRHGIGMYRCHPFIKSDPFSHERAIPNTGMVHVWVNFGIWGPMEGLRCFQSRQLKIPLIKLATLRSTEPEDHDGRRAVLHPDTTKSPSSISRILKLY